jgi:peptide/nickel transport system ATP-binding protein
MMVTPVIPSVLEVRDLSVHFGDTPAVESMSFDLRSEETLGLVGESGSGKSMTALAVLGLLPTNARVSGSIRIDGQDVLTMGERRLSALRGKTASMIFQEPALSLNPVMSVGRQVSEVVVRHEGLSRAAARARAIELFDLVGLRDPAQLYSEYPHRLSGGMQQRVMISIAIACRPKILIADEPTTALDVTVQAQVLELIDRLRRQLSMSVLLITHDIGVVADWTDRVIVMQAGRKREEAPTARLLADPQHPYTRQLLAASLPLGSDLHFRTGRLPEMTAAANPIEGADAAAVR